MYNDNMHIPQEKSKESCELFKKIEKTTDINNIVKPPDNTLSLIESNVGNEDYRAKLINRIIYYFDSVRFLIRYHFSLYMRYGKAYVPFDEALFYNYIYQYGLSNSIILTPQECSNISKCVQIHTCDYLGEPDDQNYTLFNNVFVDNNTGEIYKDVDVYFPTVWVNANYIPNQPLIHPTFDAFLTKLCDNDIILITRIWEIIGYAISSDCKAKRIFLLIGESGSNGKSAFLSFLGKLLPHTAVAHCSMSNLLTGRFAGYELYLKRLCISGDEGYCNLNSEQLGFLKTLSGAQDYIQVDVKGKRQVSFLPTCKLFLASNYDLGISYTACGEAIAKRLCRIPFNVQIPKEEQDPEIVSKLLIEKDAIVTTAYWHYLNLKRRGYIFTGDDIYDNNVILTPNSDQYRIITDFCTKYCDYSTSNSYVYTNQLYEAFKSVYGEVFPDITSFSRAFLKVSESISKEISKKRYHTLENNAWGFQGVKLK